MIAALIGSMIDDRLGSGAVLVSSAGFGPPGIPAIADAVDAMRRRGLDVSAHRSRQANAEIARSADLDPHRGTRSRDPHRLARSCRIPAIDDAAGVHHRGVRRRPAEDEPVTGWVQRLTAARTAQAYLRDPIEQVDDPTGLPGRAFEAAVVDIEAQCSMAATMIARALDRSPS